MFNIKNIVEKEFGYKNIILEVPKSSDMGDISIPCFNLRTEEEKNPIAIAEKVAKFLSDLEYVDEVKIAGAYVNIFVNPEYLANNLIEDILSKKYFDSFNIGNSEKLLIEHTSINPNASPHVGRSRNSILSDTLVRIMRYAKYDVEVNYFVNDIGLQIAYLVVAFDELDDKDVPFSDILQMYIDINRRSKEDPSISERAYKYLNELENGNLELKEKFKSIAKLCVDGQRKIFDRLGVKFDIFTFESDYVFKNKTEDVLEALSKTGKLHEDKDDGRLYVDLEGYDIPTKTPVLVLTRADKTTLYPMRDIAYTIDKMNKVSDNNYIVLGEDQKTYMQQIQAVLDILGYNYPKLISYSFITLNGDSMGTRKGNLVLLEDLLDEVANNLRKEFENRNENVTEEKLQKLAVSVVKYSILSTSKDKTINFNVDNVVNFTGNTAIYLIYNSVRIKSILSKSSFDIDNCDYSLLTNDMEKELLMKMYRFNDTVESVFNKKDPVVLCNYIYDLVNTFSKYYSSVNILNEEDSSVSNVRLLLIKSLDLILDKALYLIGFETIEKL